MTNSLFKELDNIKLAIKTYYRICLNEDYLRNNDLNYDEMVWISSDQKYDCIRVSTDLMVWSEEIPIKDFDKYLKLKVFW